MPEIHCRHFNGYKPCGKSDVCDSLCPSRDVPSLRILVVHLEALGAVLRATSILPAIKRKFPSSHITWVTKSPAQNFFVGNPFIDRILTTSHEDLLALQAIEFDIGFCIDKSNIASGVLRQTFVDQLYGFRTDPQTGAILPATKAAEELWSLGLSNQKKFFENEKAETQLMVEALELGEFRRDEYQIFLNPTEKELARQRREKWLGQNERIIGLNTGCSHVIPYKKLSVDFHRQLIREIEAQNLGSVVLLGGPEDRERNDEIARGLPIVVSPVDRGLRDGFCSVEACDIVVSGDSLGMHMAIALKKWTIAWFGPTCSQEIDLYDRGVSIKTQASCAPCWKRNCQKTTMCYDLVSSQEIMQAIQEGINWQSEHSSSKQPSSEISF